MTTSIAPGHVTKPSPHWAMLTVMRVLDCDPHAHNVLEREDTHRDHFYDANSSAGRGAPLNGIYSVDLRGIWPECVFTYTHLELLRAP